MCRPLNVGRHGAVECSLGLRSKRKLLAEQHREREGIRHREIETQKRDLCLLRERTSIPSSGSGECKGPGPGLHLGKQAGQHVVLMEEDRRLDMHSRAMWSSFTSFGWTQVDLRWVAGTLVGSEQGLWQL